MKLPVSSSVSSDVRRPVPALERQLERFAAQPPEIVFEWCDRDTSARGYLVINSLRGGAAGGGTRMSTGLSKDEVISLAKTMEVKFTVAGPPIGGSKAGIAFDPADTRKEEVLRRWFAVIGPLLQQYCGTGGDLNINEVKEVIPITAAQGIAHPQAGIVEAHFGSGQEPSADKIARLQQGVSQLVDDLAYTPAAGRYAVADLITGYGVAEATRHYYALWHGGTLQGKRTVIQGWGNVAAAAAFYLAAKGAQIVGIIDRQGGLLVPEGLTLEDVRRLFISRSGNQLVSAQLIPFAEANAHIWDIGAEIFVPAAASRLITHSQSERLMAAGLEVITCGANVPFVEDEMLYGVTTQYVDDRVSLLPDFIASSAMARVFAYLMGYASKGHLRPADIFEDASSCIVAALKKLQPIFAHWQVYRKSRPARSTAKVTTGQLGKSMLVAFTESSILRPELQYLYVFFAVLHVVIVICT